jgi:AraC family transcriptional regulator of adaptative response / DNA-3-methyladenine glycosylase II
MNFDSDRMNLDSDRMDLDSDRVWHAVEACDPRFDGWIFCGVKTTGIYCRPSCPARTPKRENVRFFVSAAAAQSAGFRACKRCRPDATPGSPEWDLRADLVGRAMRLIADGVVDREGVGGLAGRLGYTERHVHRRLVAVAGAGPLALARAQRAQTARILLETTALSISGVAFAAGFRSVRQFNATVQEIFVTTPGALRARARRYGRPEDSGALSLRLPYRAPLDGGGLIAFLGLRAVPGVEEAIDGAYRRSLRLPHGTGAVELRPADGHVQARYWLTDLRDLGAAMQRSRTLLDLDSDPQSVVDVLGREPLLGPLVRSAPGRRVAGAVDGHELAVRAVLGQQVSLRGAATLAGRLAAHYGEQLERPLGAVTHVFPSAQALANSGLDGLAMPAARRRGLLALVTALARRELAIDVGADRLDARRQLRALPGIGPWTAEYIAMRALRDPDAFPSSDLGVRRALEQLGRDGRPVSAETLAEGWRPYRAYAVQHLWASLAPPARARREPTSSDAAARLAA